MHNYWDLSSSIVEICKWNVFIFHPGALLWDVSKQLEGCQE